MGKMLKAIGAMWGFLGSKALVGATSSLVLPLVTSPLAKQILGLIEELRFSKLLGIPGNRVYIDLFIGVLGLSIAFLAKKMDEEEL